MDMSAYRFNEVPVPEGRFDAEIQRWEKAGYQMELRSAHLRATHIESGVWFGESRIVREFGPPESHFFATLHSGKSDGWMLTIEKNIP